MGETADNDPPLGEHAAALLAAEHWSLLSARSLIWSEAQSRVTVFLTVLSASIVALAGVRKIALRGVPGRSGVTRRLSRPKR